jgi:hypothetical protein
VRVQPDEGITMKFGSKVPGTQMEVRDVTMDFMYGDSFTESSPEAYERLILDVLLGDPPLFPRHEEVEMSWRILDPILDHWAAERQTRHVRPRHLGPGQRRRDARPRRSRLATAMTTRLENTSADEIVRTINAERHKIGATSTGMVLTLIIVTDEENQSDTTRAAAHSAMEHPCRIITMIPRPGRVAPALDANIDVGDTMGPGETVRLRLRGELADHGASVALPLLLPDTPVVVWWPTNGPDVPSADPFGPHGAAPDHRCRRRSASDAGLDRPPQRLCGRRH